MALLWREAEPRMDDQGARRQNRDIAAVRMLKMNDVQSDSWQYEHERIGRQNTTVRPSDSAGQGKMEWKKEKKIVGV